MVLFDPDNLPPAPNPMIQSNPSFAQSIQTSKGVVSIQPGDWVALNPSLGFEDPIRKNLFQVSAVINDGLTIGILYTQDGGLTYQSTNLSASWVMFVFRMQPGS